MNARLERGDCHDQKANWISNLGLDPKPRAVMTKEQECMQLAIHSMQLVIQTLVDVPQ